MPISYPNLAMAIALRLNQLRDGVTAAALESDFATGDAASHMDGMEVPYSSLKLDILAIEPQIATMIGLSENNLLRSALKADEELESGGDLPLKTGKDRRFVGKPDGIFNSATDLPLTEMPKDIVIRQIRNPGGFFKLKHECFAIEGTKILYSCSDKALDEACCCTEACTCSSGTAYMRGVAFSDTAAAAAYAANGDSVLPVQVLPLWRSMVLSIQVQESWFADQAAYYQNLAAVQAQAIGLVYDPGKMSDVLMTNKENPNAKNENR